MLPGVEDLEQRAHAWLAEDPDPDTRAALREALASGDTELLERAFAAPLAFGTAGIRGPLGPGPAHMNRLVVRRVAAGLAARLAREGPPEAQLVIVGHDARHKSSLFATDIAGVLRGAGFEVRAFERPVPTPLLAYAVRRTGAAAGVQVTASHNPPEDNGCKVYWAGGAQIVAPLDAEIAKAMARASGSDISFDTEATPATPPAPDVEGAYRAGCLATVGRDGPRAVRLVYTPLHGVAGTLTVGLLESAGFRDVHVVDEQAAPDPDFPTVPYPNPEEAGAMDLAFALAVDVGADVVIANDPDGDRIAVAVPDRGGWRTLTGDEVGCLLAQDLLERGEGPDRLVATTVVSSQMLRRIAAAHGVGYAETLTGFKWLAPAMAEGRRRGQEPVLAYEQALGVMIGDEVLDKDGIRAAVVIADLAARLRADGRTVTHALDDLALLHGVHATAGPSVRVRSPAEARAPLERLRADPPEGLAGIAVAAVADYRSGRRRERGGAESAISLPSTDLLSLELVDGSRVHVRPSGTEPRLKGYVEAVQPVGEEGLGAARARAVERRDALARAFEALVGSG